MKGLMKIWTFGDLKHSSLWEYKQLAPTWVRKLVPARSLKTPPYEESLQDKSKSLLWGSKDSIPTWSLYGNKSKSLLWGSIDSSLQEVFTGIRANHLYRSSKTWPYGIRAIYFYKSLKIHSNKSCKQLAFQKVFINLSPSESPSAHIIYLKKENSL